MLKRPKQHVALSLDTQTTVPNGVPTFVAFGEPDDHLRLSVLIAHELGERTGRHDEVAACLTPKATWAERRNTLKGLIGRVQPKTPLGIVAVIVDLDALLPDDDDSVSRWDDWDFQEQRRQLFELLGNAIRENRWMAIRPRPRSAVSDQFPAEMLKAAKIAYNNRIRNKYNGEPLGKVAQRIGSAYVPLLDWLLGQKRGPSFEDLEDILEVGRVIGLQRHLVMQICDMLPPLALEAAIVISAVRGPQQLNGSLGPFSLLSTNEASAETRAIEESAWRLGGWRTLPTRSQVDLLHQCGFLQPAPWVGPDYVYMPNVIRRHLQGLGWLAAPELQEKRHGLLANGENRMNAGGIGTELEMHFHAVRGHDLDRAKATSRYYGADLRELAFHRSRRAAEKTKLEDAAALYREAADIYNLIIDDFDSDDAYAHEYLGYNLARAVALDARMGKTMAEEVCSRIRKAYQFAVEREPNNPLFEGRWLGFRAQCGEDVRDVFEAKLEGYRKNVSDVAAGYFAEAVLHGWSRNPNRRALAEELRQKWAPHVTRLREPLHDE